jgi:uncharacterized phage-like protein YoqJ
MIVAGTGHRPPKLGGYTTYAWQRLLLTAERAIELLEPDQIITGMALGWDQALATQALEMGIPYIAAVPFKGQENMWPESSKRQYHHLLHYAHSVITVCEGGYSAASMQRRNEWMVNNCHVVLALWDGSAGGTANCVNYAKHVKRPMKNAWPIFLDTK